MDNCIAAAFRAALLPRSELLKMGESPVSAARLWLHSSIHTRTDTVDAYVDCWQNWTRHMPFHPRNGNYLDPSGAGGVWDGPWEETRDLRVLLRHYLSMLLEIPAA